MKLIFGQFSAGFKRLQFGIFVMPDETLHKVNLKWEATKATQHLPGIHKHYELNSIESGEGFITVEELLKAADEFRNSSFSYVDSSLIPKVSCAQVATVNPSSTEGFGRVRKLPNWAMIRHDFLSRLGDDWGTCAEVMDSLINSKAGVI